MEILLVFIAIFPGILICYFIYRMDRYEKESPLNLYLSFLMGMVITLPVLKLEEWSHRVGLENNEQFWLTLISSFIIVALSEELIKLAALLSYPFRQSFFNEPIDGIIYSVMIAMGFATLENVLYAYRYSIETILLRAVTAVPAHAAFAVIMGYFAGKARFTADPRRRRRLLLTALFFPVAIHGTYDFFILQELYDWLILLAVPVLSVSIYFALRLLREHQEGSPFRK